MSTTTKLAGNILTHRLDKHRLTPEKIKTLREKRAAGAPKISADLSWFIGRWEDPEVEELYGISDYFDITSSVIRYEIPTDLTGGIKTGWVGDFECIHEFNADSGLIFVKYTAAENWQMVNLPGMDLFTELTPTTFRYTAFYFEKEAPTGDDPPKKQCVLSNLALIVPGQPPTVPPYPFYAQPMYGSLKDATDALNLTKPEFEAEFIQYDVIYVGPEIVNK